MSWVKRKKSRGQKISAGHPRQWWAYPQRRCLVQHQEQSGAITACAKFSVTGQWPSLAGGPSQRTWESGASGSVTSSSLLKPFSRCLQSNYSWPQPRSHKGVCIQFFWTKSWQIGPARSWKVNVLGFAARGVFGHPHSPAVPAQA